MLTFSQERCTLPGFEETRRTESHSLMRWNHPDIRTPTWFGREPKRSVQLSDGKMQL
jgi:hypothetical protein